MRLGGVGGGNANGAGNCPRRTTTFEFAPAEVLFQGIRLAIRYLQDLAPSPEVATVPEVAPIPEVATVPEEAAQLNLPHERCF